MWFIAMIELILIIVVTIKINQLYHKIFNVVYFSFVPVITEWLICFFIGAFIVTKIFNFFGISFADK